MPGLDIPPDRAGLPAAPDYDTLQQAFHHAFREELGLILDGLPLQGEAPRVLDAPCGAGFYARCLAERLPEGGKLSAVDISADYLKEAERRLAERHAPGRYEVIRASVYALPFPEATFDLVWCAQSLISVADAPRALTEFFRVLKPGGRLAVLEGDEFHHLLLPWPVAVEVAVSEAVRATLVARYGDADRLSPVRALRPQLEAAGFAGVARQTRAVDRGAPFPPEVAEFLLCHLLSLREFIRPQLAAAADPATLAEFDARTRPDSERAFHRAAAVELTCLNAVYTAEKPG